MRYTRISSECVKRLLEDGYVLSEGDKAYIDEVSIMTLSENQEIECTDMEFVTHVIFRCRPHLKRLGEAQQSPAADSSSLLGPSRKTGIWERVRNVIQMMVEPSEPSPWDTQ